MLLCEERDPTKPKHLCSSHKIDQANTRIGISITNQSGFITTLITSVLTDPNCTLNGACSEISAVHPTKKGNMEPLFQKTQMALSFRCFGKLFLKKSAGKFFPHLQRSVLEVGCVLCFL